MQPLLPLHRLRCQAHTQRCLSQLKTLSVSTLEVLKQRLTMVCTLPPQTHRKIHTLSPHLDFVQGIAKGSRYYYDFMTHFRFFPKNLRYHLEYGDVNYNLLIPAFCKSRPIPTTQYSYNVLFPLDTRRHFKYIFPTSHLPFEAKQNTLFFRGACIQPHRIAFLKKFFDHPLMDIGHVGIPLAPLTSFIKSKASIATHLKHKFILSLEGYDVASNLKWILSSNSIAVMPKPKFETFFLESRLVPNVHYIPIKDDYSDIETQLEFFTTHPKDCLEIIANANAYVRAFLSPMENLIVFLVLRKYFYATQQIQVSPLEQSLFV
ncbi:glycosyl transferase family 90 [Helicobacter baculiformis]|uniref:Glycosyl transferase family 90 n=1 Tax=Helicobacter baculiformis TaxID=427351 RepID=A0ABV7ZGE7_9HELI|nr:glycosyl transferase family 90 [Helicobacter baculiformis]